VKVVKHITVEKRTVTLALGSSIGAAACAVDPVGCCSSASGSGASGSGASGSNASGSGGSGGAGNECCSTGETPFGDSRGVTLANISNMACLHGATSAISRAGPGPWTSVVNIPVCNPMGPLNLQLYCSEDVWTLNYDFADSCVPPGAATFVSASCDPVELVFTISTGGGCGASGSPSSFRVTIA